MDQIAQALTRLAAGRVMENCVTIFRNALDECIDGDISLAFTVKGDGSLVSTLEHRIESLMGEYLRDTTPWAGLHSEEGLEYRGSEPFTWYLDPIDGTISFRNGLPFFAFTLTLVLGQEPVASVIDIPRLNKTYIAMRGQGASCNGRRLDLRQHTAHSHSILALSDAYTFGLCERERVLEALRRTDYIVRTYTDAFGYTLVAEGACIAKFDAAGALWDIWPGYLLVKEAGGDALLFEVANPQPDLHASVLVGHPAVVGQLAELLSIEGALGSANQRRDF